MSNGISTDASYSFFGGFSISFEDLGFSHFNWKILSYSDWLSSQKSDSSKSLKGFKVHFRRANPTTTSTTTTTTRRTTTLASSNSNNQIPSSDDDSEQASDNHPSDRNKQPSDETENDETENVAAQCQINGDFYEIGTTLSPICPVGYQPSGNIKEVALSCFEFSI